MTILRRLSKTATDSLDVVAGANVALQVHVDLGATLLVLNLIYQLIDKVDAAAVVGIDVLADERAADFGGIETFTGVADHDEKSAAFVARDSALHVLAAVIATAVNDGIRQGLAQRDLKLELL